MTEDKSLDLSEILFKLQEEWRSVFMAKIENQVFFYRPLGRGEYRKIATDVNLSDLQKQEVVCETCTLWPEKFDFEDCLAGIPTELYNQILRNSLLDSTESRERAVNYYRQEMFDFDNQISCIINEAFPNFDIEEIEMWDVERTAKYLASAEWKLHHLRGIPFTAPEGAYAAEPPQQQPEAPKVVTEEVTEPKNSRGGKKEKLTPERLAELKAKFPDIPWDQDTVMQTGGIVPDHVDTTPPALRTGA